jgi:hypothetical protein
MTKNKRAEPPQGRAVGPQAGAMTRNERAMTRFGWAMTRSQNARPAQTVAGEIEPPSGGFVVEA